MHIENLKLLSEIKARIELLKGNVSDLIDGVAELDDDCDALIQLDLVTQSLDEAIEYLGYAEGLPLLGPDPAPFLDEDWDSDEDEDDDQDA